jgi:hypothetical protein
MKSFVLTFILVALFPFGSHAGSPASEGLGTPAPEGFESDARSAHSSKVLLAKLSKNAQLHMSGVSFVVCQYTGAERKVCSRLFKMSADGFIEEINPVVREEVLSLLATSDIKFDAQMTNSKDTWNLSVDGEPARHIYKKLSKVYTDYDEGPGYTKETRNGTNIKCFSIQTEGLKKYTCKISLHRD